MMPYTVISGFMTGIGIILIVLQFGPFLGQITPPGGVVGTLQSLPQLVADIHPTETALALGTFALLMLFPRRIAHLLPPQLIALVAGSLVSIWLLGDDNLRRIGEIPTGLPQLQIPVFSAEQWTIMLADAVVLAVLGSIDALLTSVIAENMTRKQGDSSKELVGQGVGNLMAGVFGGIPGAGATMGTVVNIQAGGRSALSGLTRAALLMVVVLWAADLTAYIPLAVLAGIAMKVGIDIIDWSFLKRAHRVSFKAAGIMYGVIALTVFVDLITAVAIGVFIANLLTIERMSKLQSDAIKAIRDPSAGGLTQDEQLLLQRSKGDILVFKLGGPLMFGVAKAIARQYAVLNKHQVLIVDFSEVPTVGVSSSLALEKMILEDLAAGRPVFLVGLRDAVKARLSRLGLLQKLPVDHVVATRQEALEKANVLLGNETQGGPGSPLTAGPAVA